MSRSSYALVLVGTDGSESSLGAVDRAALLARDASGTLLVVCAYRPLPDRALRDASSALGEEAYRVSGSSPAEAVLADAAARARALGAQDVRTEAVEGDPVDALAALAEERSADLVVIGNRGLNSLAGRVLGSVPSGISHRAGCDVLIVHTTGRGAKQQA